MSDNTMALRPIEIHDLEYLHILAMDPVVRSNVVGWGWPQALSSHQAWYDRGTDSDTTRRFIIHVEDIGQVGMIGLWQIDWRNKTAEVGLKIGGRDGLRGRGFGTSALRKLTDFAFADAGLRRLHSEVLDINSTSQRLFTTAGWSREGVLRQHVWRAGDYRDVIQFGILAKEHFRTSGK